VIGLAIAFVVIVGLMVALAFRLTAFSLGLLLAGVAVVLRLAAVLLRPALRR
jgi:hypothetical protein